jgi:hypothetical protein
MLELHHDDLSAADRAFSDAVKFVYDGLKSPFVCFEVKRTLYKLLFILSDEGRISKQEINVPVTIVPFASELFEELREKLINSKCGMSYAHRERVRDVINRTGYDLSRALSRNTFQAVKEICARIMPAGVQYSIVMTTRSCVEVYIDDVHIAEPLLASINTIMADHRIVGTAAVRYSNNGSLLHGFRLEGTDNKCAERCGNEAPRGEQLGQERIGDADHEVPRGAQLGEEKVGDADHQPHWAICA